MLERGSPWPLLVLMVMNEDAMSIIHLTHQCLVLNGLHHDFRDSKCPQRLNNDEVVYPFEGLIHFKGHHVKGSL
jgi:hypothetical protein